MKPAVDSSAVYSRSVGPSPAERFADVDRERRRQLDELCRPVPGARSLRQLRRGRMPRASRFPDDPNRHKHIASVFLPADVLADIQAESKRRGVTISALMREAWVLARPDMRNLPVRVRP